MNTKRTQKENDREITNSVELAPMLNSFFLWYEQWHTSRFISVLETCMTGYFHISTKQATELRKRCEELGFITVNKNKFEIIVQKDEKSI